MAGHGEISSSGNERDVGHRRTRADRVHSRVDRRTQGAACILGMIPMELIGSTGAIVA
jgi:hypothetical protein